MKTPGIAIVALAACGLVALAGCGGSSSANTGLDAKTAAVQDSADSDSLINQTMDAANQVLLMHATTSGGDPVSSTSLPTATGHATADEPSLPRLAVDVPTVTIDNLTNTLGAKRFPNCSGSFEVQSSGEVINSWPTASSSVGTFTVTITFNQGPVTFTDPSSGAVATISSGSIQYSLDANSSYTSNLNWQVQLDSSLVVASGSPLAITVTRSGIATRTLSVFGARDAHLTLTRVHDGGPTDTYSIDAMVDGNPHGVTGVDTGTPSQSFTNWDVTINGLDHIVWNRFAHLRYHWDFVAFPAGPPHIDQLTEEIFFTYNGTQTGPFTGALLVTGFHATSK